MDTDFAKQKKTCQSTAEALQVILMILKTQEQLPRAERLWGGADVVIHFKPRPHDGESCFYPAPRMVYSKHARELSWLFEALRDAFCLEALVDGCSKIEFYGRLANAANRKIAEAPDASAKEVCDAVFNEAMTMYSEIKKHEFKTLAVAFGGEIADDRAHRQKK